MPAVFLTGFMGSGKSTVGPLLAERLHWRFIDLDRRIEDLAQRVEARVGRTVAEIFTRDGEACFRKAESEALREVAGELEAAPAVVALGGGALMTPENAALLAQYFVVHLDAPVEELWQRCQQQGSVRPLAQERARFDSLYANRQAGYATAAFRVHTEGRTPSCVAEMIQTWLDALK